MLRLPFLARFAIILVALSGLIAGITAALIAAQGDSVQRRAALDRVADRASVALDLFDGRRRALEELAAAAAAQDAAVPGLAPGTFAAELSRVAASGDLVVIVDDGLTLVAQRGNVEPSDATTAWLAGAARAAGPIVSDSAGSPWLTARSSLSAASTLLLAQPLADALGEVLPASPADASAPDARTGVAVIRDGRFAVDGSLATRPVHRAQAIPAALAGVTGSGGAVIGSLDDADTAAVRAPLGDGYALLVTVLVAGGTPGSVAVPVVLVSAALLLFALLIAVRVVDRDLQRPLARLARAVSALAAGDFSVPLPQGRDEIGRLGTAFEAMRADLQGVLRGMEARAAIATDLSALSPLSAALEAVCARLRDVTGAEHVLVAVHDELAEEVYQAGLDAAPSPGRLLRGEGPMAAASELPPYQALVACPLPGSAEWDAGLREVCAAPLRIHDRVQGAVALGDGPGGFGRVEIDLVGAAAEQISLAIERDRVLAAARLQASTDTLTGLSNRRFLTAYLAQQVAVADRSRTSFSVLMLDVDHFKRINDQLGHDVGDRALVAVARRMEACLRRSDLAARWGGDEFVVVMTETKAGEAMVVAEKVRTAIAEAPLDVGRLQTLGVTVSVGVATRQPEGLGAEALLGAADHALYVAKRGGRNRSMLAGGTQPAPRDGTERNSGAQGFRAGDVHG